MIKKPLTKAKRICIAGLCAAAIFFGNGYVYELIMDNLLVPVQQAAAKNSEVLMQSLTPPKSREELEKEVSELREENRRLSEMLVDYYDVKSENAELRRFYDIKKENRDFSVVTAAVIARDPNESFCGFTLDKGTSDGVEINSPVLTENGLVGRVCEVTRRSCRVTTILSPEAGIGAVISRTGDSGIIVGSPELSENGLTGMANIPSGNEIRAGDIVVTSGAGGVFPKNLRIGKISRIYLDDYTGMPAASVEPYEKPSEASGVLIIVDFDGKDEISQADEKHKQKEK